MLFKSINFMAKHGRGLICLALSKYQVERLRLSLMSRTNKSRMQTAFTISLKLKKVSLPGSLHMIEQKQLR